MDLGVRRLTSSDSGLALSLAAEADLEGEVALRFDRSPDYFAWPLASLDRWAYLGAFGDGRLVGYALVGFRRGWIGDRWGTYAFSGDLRVRPSVRRKGVGALLLKAVSDEIPLDVKLVAGTILQGNERGLGLAFRRTPRGFRLTDQGALIATTRFAIRGQADPRVLTLGPGDIPDVVRLLEDSRRGLFAPEPSEAEARRLIDPGLPAPGFALGLRERNRLVALVALRDLNPVRRSVVLREPLRMSLLRRGLGVAYALGQALPLPPVGEPLRALTLTRLLVSERTGRGGTALRLRTARALTRAAQRAAYERRIPLIHMGLHETDRHRPAVEYGLHYSHGLRLVVAVDQRGGPASCPMGDGPPVLDFGLV